ncbi:Metallo-dependent phosphatase-like protein [Chaetomium fimeti]|uniref:Metallo-dependent phosphatase-like protein n=1 Tax=Chaetomium fimeti TaxID=1854472 RepID=A0AAE0HJ80_9PEZI|nr:Metallo-dependent phosphatase-like protein [Chaetomium fimeti]
MSTSSTARPTRRTRIVCISDTHNSTVKLPKGDVLIHAGDLTNQGSYSELSKAVQWLEKADFEAKIVIAGNHDITLDRDFYSKHGSSFHNQTPQDPAECLSLFTSSSTITYLQNESATVRLASPNGPGTEFTIFGSPYSPRYGTWAFMYPRSSGEEPESSGQANTAAELWAAIPPTTDILVTHTPPYSHCDDACGCEELRKTLAKVRPRLHVCGHVHQGRGAERVRWNTDDLAAEDEAVAAAEASVEAWEDPHPDPSSAKISLVDLTARGGKRPLDFHNAARPVGDTSDRRLPDPAQRVPCASSHPGPGGQDRVVGPGDPVVRIGNPDSAPEHGGAVISESTGQPVAMDRTGRRETCIVNCAIVATGWPHTGGKRFNKPIVVDLDLPVWR